MEGNTNQDGQVPDTGQENGEITDEDHEKLTWVLSGNLESLPAQSSKIVRIFTSSTFTGKSYCVFFFKLWALDILEYLSYLVL